MNFHRYKYVIQSNKENRSNMREPQLNDYKFEKVYSNWDILNVLGLNV